MNTDWHRIIARDINDELVRVLQCRDGTFERVQELVNRGADVNGLDEEGRSILMRAVSDRHVAPDGIRCLITLGADTNAVNRDGWSVLKQAVFSGRLDVVEVLVEAGVAIDPEDDHLLFTACVDGGLEVVAFLLSKGLNPNVMIGETHTALDTVELIRKGLKPDGKHISEWAEQLDKVVRVLQDAGAKHAYELRAKRLGTWLHVTGHCPTGLYTNTGCLPVVHLPGASKEFCEHFQEWLPMYLRLWGTSDGGEFLTKANDFEKVQNREKGLALAAEIKRLVGPAVEVTYGGRCPDPEAEAGYRHEWHAIR